MYITYWIDYQREKKNMFRNQLEPSTKGLILTGELSGQNEQDSEEHRKWHGGEKVERSSDVKERVLGKARVCIIPQE